MLKRFSLWLVKNLIVILAVTLIFSTVAFDLPNLAKGVFSDIFEYSSPQAQKQVIGKMTETCSLLDKEGIQVKPQSPNLPDLGKIGSLCKDYKDGKINDREFFFNVISGAIPQRIELPKMSALERYNAAIGFLNRNKIMYFIILAVLMVLMYLLTRDTGLFMLELAGILLSIGIFILVPYAAIIAYNAFVGIDTTPALSSIMQGSLTLDIKAIISVALLMIMRTYNSFTLTLGGVFLALGISGKIYGRRLVRQGGITKQQKFNH